MGIGRIDIGERRQVEKLQPLHIILKDDTVSSTVHSIEDIGEICNISTHSIINTFPAVHPENKKIKKSHQTLALLFYILTL